MRGAPKLCSPTGIKLHLHGGQHRLGSWTTSQGLQRDILRVDRGVTRSSALGEPVSRQASHKRRVAHCTIFEAGPCEDPTFCVGEYDLALIKTRRAEMSAIRRAIYFAAIHSADHGIGEEAFGELDLMEKKILELEAQVQGFIGKQNMPAWKEQMGEVDKSEIVMTAVPRKGKRRNVNHPG